MVFRKGGSVIPTGEKEPSPESLQVFAERRIKTLIGEGAIAPGTRLSPQLLAPELGLSHIPVREALASLAASGFVSYQPRRGYITRELSSEDLADLYHWRQVLEREAYVIAVSKLTDDDIAEMKRLAELMSELTGSKDRLEYLRLNREFHFVPFKRAGSERLLRFLNLLWDAAAPYTTLEMPESSKGNADHLAMLKYFEARDIIAAIATADKHRGDRMARVAQWEAAHMPGEPGEPPKTTKPRPRRKH